MRKVVGPQFIIGMRVTGVELVEGRLSEDECVDVTQQLARSGDLDILNILAGSLHDHLGLSRWTCFQRPILTIAGQIRKAIDLSFLVIIFILPSTTH